MTRSSTVCDLEAFVHSQTISRKLVVLTKEGSHLRLKLIPLNSRSSMVCDLEAFCSLANHFPQTCRPDEGRVSFEASSSFSKIVIFAIRWSVTRSSMVCDLEAFSSLTNQIRNLVTLTKEGSHLRLVLSSRSRMVCDSLFDGL